ncbi:hypothetical protein RCC89_05115 [Cytophagaceae bacterium ABcell3]|nr:hypothetical protein RCC89_05115 [Cytophagaceae bacterium ABcell3]
MKNKKVTVFLLVAVVLVWGVALWQILAPNQGSSGNMVSTKNVDLTPISFEADSFALLLNYKDPFHVNAPRKGFYANGRSAYLGKKKSDNVSKVAVKKNMQITEHSIEAEKVPDIRYLGLIRNNQTNKEVAFVVIDNSKVFVSEGDNVKGISFDKNFRDSIQVGLNGKTFFIKKG